MPEAWTSFGDITIVDHIVIGRNISVPGDQLCQDGVNVYFKDSKYCYLENYDHSCRTNFIAPLRQAERIYTQKNYHVFRFYNVRTKYKSYFFKMDKNGDFFHEKTTSHEMPFCEDLPVQKTTIVYSERYALREERPFVENLINKGITSINTSFGPLLNLHMVNQDYHQLSFLSFMDRTNIRSPLCIEGDYHRDLIKQLSGEYSGGGFNILNINLLQSLSGEIVLPENQSVNSTNPSKYTFECVPTLTI